MNDSLFQKLNFEDKKKKLLLMFWILKESLPEHEKDLTQYTIIIKNYKDTKNQWIFMELYKMIQNMIYKSRKSQQQEIYAKIQKIHEKEQEDNKEDPDMLLNTLFTP